MKGRSHHRLQSSDPKDDWVNGSWTVDCVCGVNFDDGEEMVNCDECGVWVHTRCSRYVKGDEIFVCDKCKIKNNKNNSEETEVAQLLVELPTKTVRIESSFAANGPPRRPFRLWTDIPIEERVHVQGIPGGDPAMFGGLPSVFTPELWKCTGYVPKKFNFRYREFPCWDEKETDARLDEDDENTVDKGAGVLFSLSKENVLANPVAALVGLRGGDEEGGACERKVCFKETEKWESEHMDARHAQNGSKKERSLIRSVVLHSGKQKKEESGTSSKDRSGKKKARVAEKEFDTKKRGTHSSKAVFTPTSDAKQLEFCEDRGPKFSKAEIQSMKNKNPSENMVREPLSDRYLGGQDNVEKYSVEAISLDMPRQDFPTEIGLKEDKVDHQLPVGLEVTPGTIDVVAPSIEHNSAGKCHVKDEGDRMAVDKLDASLKGSDKNLAKPPVEVVPSTEPEVKSNQVQDLNVDMSLRSEKPDFEVKKEVLDENSGSLLNIRSSPHNDVNHPYRSDDKVNDTSVSCSQSIDPKAEDVDQSLNAVGDSHMDKAEQLSGDPMLKTNFECTEGSIAMQKSFSEPKHGSGLPEEPSKPGGTAVSSPSMLIQHKMVASAGKPSVSSTTLIPKSSNSDNVKPSDVPLPNPIAKPRISVDCNVNTRKDCSSLDSRDEGRDDTPRRTVKEHSKSFVNSIPKPSHSSRIPHDSFSKRTTSESKDSGPSATSKTSLAPNIAATSSCGEPTGLLHHQKAIHAHYKGSPSGVPQRGEKINQTNFPLSSKSNQNHGPTPCPPTVSSSPAALSDEELALLLHQELNSSPRVPRVPRVRHAGSVPQLASPSPTSMLTKRTSSSGGKDHSSVSRRKNKDAPKDGPRGSRELADEAKKMNRVSSSHDQKRHDVEDTPEASSKREGDGSSTMLESGKKNIPSTSATTANSGPSSSTEANDRIVSSKRSSPRNASDDDAGTVGGPVHRTLPGLINEIMSKGRRMTYEELCNAVLPHWHNLRKHNGERYAYSSHSQAVLDCLRNRHEWARLVDRGPKTNSSRKRRKLDAEESEDNEYGKGKSANQVESKSLESQREEFPKGKRKARKRRRLALQGRGIKEIRKRRKSDVITDEDFGTSSNSSEESRFSNDENQGGGGACPEGSEDTASSDEAGIM